MLEYVRLEHIADIYVTKESLRFNGEGTILFDARIPDQGSHSVFDRNYQPIEFSATQNFFHELVHARHLTSGTWCYFDSERHAIEEENIMRRELASLSEIFDVPLRATKLGEHIWLPESEPLRQDFFTGS